MTKVPASPYKGRVLTSDQAARVALEEDTGRSDSYTYLDQRWAALDGIAAVKWKSDYFSNQVPNDMIRPLLIDYVTYVRAATNRAEDQWIGKAYTNPADGHTIAIASTERTLPGGEAKLLTAISHYQPEQSPEHDDATRRPALLAALREVNIDFRSGADQRTSAADLQRLLSAAHHLRAVDRPRSNQGRNEMTPRCAGSTSPAAAESDGRSRCPYCGHRINVTANGKLFIHNGRRASAPPKARTSSRGAGHQQRTNNNA